MSELKAHVLSKTESYLKSDYCQMEICIQFCHIFPINRVNLEFTAKSTEFFFFFFFLATPVECGSSQARDQTQATVETTAVTTPVT